MNTQNNGNMYYFPELERLKAESGFFTPSIAKMALEKLQFQNSFHTQSHAYIKNRTNSINQSNLYTWRDRISWALPKPPINHNTIHLEEGIVGSELTRISYWQANESYIEPNCCLLVICAVILSGSWGRFTIAHHDHRESSVIQVFAFAASGKRKSLVANKAFQPVLDFETRLKSVANGSHGPLQTALLRQIVKTRASDLIKEMDLTDPNSVHAVMKRAGMEDKEIHNELLNRNKEIPNINLDHITPYRLAQLLESNGCTQTLFTSEATTIEELYFHKDIQLLLKTFDQEPYTYSTRCGHRALPHPGLYVGTFGQLDVGRKLFGSQKLRERGITARILPFVNLRNTPVCYSGLYGNECDVYSTRINRLFEMFHTRDQYAKRYVIGIEEEAYKLIREFKEEMCDAPKGIPQFDSWLSKMHGQAIRLAFAFHLWENFNDPCASKISIESIQRGIALVKTIAPSAYFLYSPTGLAPTQNAIKILRSWQRIEVNQSRINFLTFGTNTTKIQQRTGIDRRAINNALHLLLETGWIALFDDGSGNFQVLPHANLYDMNIPEI